MQQQLEVREQQLVSQRNLQVVELRACHGEETAEAHSCRLRTQLQASADICRKLRSELAAANIWSKKQAQKLEGQELKLQEQHEARKMKLTAQDVMITELKNELKVEAKKHEGQALKLQEQHEARKMELTAHDALITELKSELKAATAPVGPCPPSWQPWEEVPHG